MSLAVLIGTLALCAAAPAEVHLAGRVIDENSAAVQGALVTLERPGSELRLSAVADPTGAFSFRVDAPGGYLLGVERQGYLRIQNRTVHLAEGANELALTLNMAREVFEKIDVAYSPPTLDLDSATSQERLTSAELLQAPYPSTNTLRNAMRAVPGVVQDSRGDVHLNGGAEEQTLYTLDGFQVNDPVTGRFESRIGVEAVRSLDVTGWNPAETGKGPAGQLAIRTTTGDNQFRYSATNFVPGLENRKGIAVGGWTPRFNVSGPLRKGRAWFSDAIDLQYDNTIVEDLPAGQDRTTSWRVGNLLRTQVNLTPSNILSAGFLTGFRIAPRNGLDALDPLETTVDRRTRQWFVNAKDQHYFRRGALFEIGFALNRTFDREIPQGHAPLVITPEGRRGNSFFDATRRGRRDEFLANLFLPSFTLLGGHQVKTGVDFDALDYRQNVARSSYGFRREDGSVSRSVAFGGSGQLAISNSEAAWYVQDSWKPRPSLLIEPGLRADWDRLTGATALSPRLGFSWAPPGLESTKISGALGVVIDETSLLLFSRPLDQYSLTSRFAPDGAPLGPPAITVFTLGKPFRAPRYTIRSLGWDKRLGSGLFLRVEYIGRRTNDGLTFSNALAGSAAPPAAIAARFGSAPFDAVYVLGNQRRDVYDAFEATVRRTFRKQYEWLASYTRSRARSTGVVDINLDEPVFITDNAGRLPWDAPNRLVSWGYLPTFWDNWAIAYLLEARDGFPFSIQDDAGASIGGPNGHRFPAFFELNLHLERKFLFRHNRWALRFGFNNITNHKNPNVVINDIASPNFLDFFGGQSRALNFRLRWLGR